jgi:hypothetical protein
MKFTIVSNSPDEIFHYKFQDPSENFAIKKVIIFSASFCYRPCFATIKGMLHGLMLYILSSLFSFGFFGVHHRQWRKIHFISEYTTSSTPSILWPPTVTFWPSMLCPRVCTMTLFCAHWFLKLPLCAGTSSAAKKNTTVLSMSSAYAAIRTDLQNIVLLLSTGRFVVTYFKTKLKTKAWELDHLPVSGSDLPRLHLWIQFSLLLCLRLLKIYDRSVTLPKGYHLDVVGGSSTPHDPESDAGGSLSSWQGHPSR